MKNYYVCLLLFQSVGTVLLQKRAKVSLDAVEKISPFGKKSASHDPRLVRQVHWPKDREQPAYTSVKVEKQHKEVRLCLWGLDPVMELRFYLESFYPVLEVRCCLGGQVLSW